MTRPLRVLLSLAAGATFFAAISACSDSPVSDKGCGDEKTPWLCQREWPPSRPRTAGSSLSLAGDVVTDADTGLMWAAKTSEGTYDRDSAIGYCQRLKLGGHEDWRLPTMAELVSLLDYGRAGPALDPVAFPDARPEELWVSTEQLSIGAWRVSFAEGHILGDKPDIVLFHARCVRDTDPSRWGQLPDERFEVTDAVAKDRATGLLWQRQPFRAGTIEELVQNCSQLSLDSKSGWRAPSIQELLTLFVPNAPSPLVGVDPAAFENDYHAPGYAVLSGTPVAQADPFAPPKVWVMEYEVGTLEDTEPAMEGASWYARCVHDAE